MASAVTVVARPGKIKSDQILVIMHAVKQETHTLSNTVTDHPVEEGFNASDHSRPEPDQVTMECLISNTPLSSLQRQQAVKAGSFTVQSSAEQKAGAVGATDGYAYKVWGDLRKLRDEGTLVTVSTTLGDYDSMAITTITSPRNSKNYDAIQFSITFKKIRVAQNARTRASERKKPGKKNSKGNQTPKEAKGQDETALLQLSDSMSKSSNQTVSGVGNFLMSGGSGGQSGP